MPSSYAIRRHAEGGGRKDILAHGEPDGVAPTAAQRPAEEPLASKLGSLSIVAFDTSKGAARHCLAFVRAYDDPLLQLSGWFCQGGADFIERSTLACALDRLMLLFAGSEPKVDALFAQSELNRSYCGQRDPISSVDAQVQEPRCIDR